MLWIYEVKSAGQFHKANTFILMQLYSTFYHWLMFAIVSAVDAKSNCIYDLQIFNWRRQLFKSIQLFLKCTSKPSNFLMKKLREFNIKKNGKVTLGYSKPQIFHGWPNTLYFSDKNMIRSQYFSYFAINLRSALCRLFLY